MVKQVVDYGLFMRTVGGAAVNGARNKAMLIAELKAEYPPEDGWELVSTEFTGQSPEGWTFAVFLQKVKYA